MSHLALRRVMIRLLHDPCFAALLYDDPACALAGAALADEERAWLLATPPAAWRTDPARPDRVGAALGEEYPASLALAAARGATFFASPQFHAAIQERGSLALAFGDHLAATDDRRVRAIARLERAVAEVRRAVRGHAAPRAALAPTTRVALAPTARLVTVPVGSLAVLAAARAGRPVPEVGDLDEPVLVVLPPTGGVTIEPVDEALAALLRRAADGTNYAVLLEEARAYGAEPGEDTEIVTDLFRDGLLVAADVSDG